MAKTQGLGLPLTKGAFQLQGIVTGTQSQSFYVERETKSKRPMRSVKFGVQFSKDDVVYVNLNGLVRDSVYFCRYDPKTKKSAETIKVPWEKRHTIIDDDTRLIGVNVNLDKLKTKVLTEYDACDVISRSLKDSMPVFIRGNLEYSRFREKSTIRLVPTTVSLCKKEFDLGSESYHSVADFQQHIVFMGIEVDEKKDKYIVNAKIVNYSSIEDAEFIILNPDLANSLRRNLKPYTALEVWGRIHIHRKTEEVTDTDDIWGETNAMTRISEPVSRQLIITGARPSSIEKETYREEVIESALAKLRAAQQAEKDYIGDSPVALENGLSDDEEW